MKVYDEKGNYVGELVIPEIKHKYFRAFETLFDLPDHPKGSIFVHDPDDKEKGSPGHGALRLAWIDCNCQNNWCGGTVVFPGQMAGYAGRGHYNKYFREIPNDGRYT